MIIVVVVVCVCVCVCVYNSLRLLFGCCIVFVTNKFIFVWFGLVLVLFSYSLDATIKEDDDVEAPDDDEDDDDDDDDDDEDDE